MTELELRLHWMRLYYQRATGRTKTAAGVRVKELERMVADNLRQVYG